METKRETSQVRSVALRGNKNKKAAQRGKLIIKMVKIQDIEKKIIKENGIPRIGGTKRDIKFRAYEYERQGYTGTIFYANAEDIKRAENELLELASRYEDGYHNKHRRSNLASVAGFIYIIKGHRGPN